MVIVKKDDYLNHLEYKKRTIKWTNNHYHLEEIDHYFDRWINFDHGSGWNHSKVTDTIWQWMS